MIIRKVRDGNTYLFTVGSLVPNILDVGQNFEPLCEFATLKEAAAFLNYLNGGIGDGWRTTQP